MDHFFFYMVLKLKSLSPHLLQMHRPIYSLQFLIFVFQVSHTGFEQHKGEYSVVLTMTGFSFETLSSLLVTSAYLKHPGMTYASLFSRVWMQNSRENEPDI